MSSPQHNTFFTKQADSETEQTTYFSIDQALQYVGDSSNYQKKARLIFAIQYIVFSFLIMGMPLFFEIPNFICNDDNNIGSFCGESVTCQLSEQHINEETSNSSIAKSFRLFCKRKYFIAVIQVFLFVGAFFGFMIYQRVADSKGRKKSMLMFTALGGISAVFAALSTNLMIFLPCFFLIGLAFKAFENIMFLYLSEISCSNRFQKFSEIMFGLIWVIAQVVLNSIDYFVNDWRVVLVVFIGLPLFSSVFLIKIKIFESPFYYCEQKKFIEARLVLNEIANIN